MVDTAEQIAEIIRSSMMPEFRRMKRWMQTGIEGWFTFNLSKVYDIDLYEKFVNSPEVGMKLTLNALVIIEPALREHIDKIRIRFDESHRKTSVKGIRYTDIGKLISVTGIVKKSTQIEPRVKTVTYICRTCHTPQTIEQATRRMVRPVSCGGYRPDGNGRCTSKDFEVITHRSTYEDSQKIQIQDAPEDMRGGEQPASIDIELAGELCGKMLPGNRVQLTGILRVEAPAQGTQNQSTTWKKYFELSSYKILDGNPDELIITEEEEEQFIKMSKDPELKRNLIKSIAPSIYGAEQIKEAVVLQMFGGVSKEVSGTKLRGDIHVLIVGDPGIAKSQILRYVAETAPRGIFTSGKSSSAVGLTAGVVKDDFGDGRWTLEAGAMVFADQGVLCVDEMDKMPPGDRSALHEGMEQQQVSVSKVGIRASLRTRCSLLGAANPKMSRFDPYLPLVEQINLEPTLLDRFDLIFICKDVPSNDMDRAIANHILSSHESGKSGKPGTSTPVFDSLTIKKYVSYAKRLRPTMSAEAREAIIDYYVTLRKKSSDTIPMTARSVEGLIRMSEAHAKMRLSSVIEISDAMAVLKLFDEALKQIITDPDTGQLDYERKAGIPKTTRDLATRIKEMVRDSGEPISINAVITTLVSGGYNSGKIESTIDQLLQNGDLMSPRRGLLKLP